MPFEAMQNPVGWAVAIVVGIIVLIWGADRFIENAAVLARKLGVSPMVIGLLVVAFGTSAPEMVVSGLAATRGESGLGVGNAIGSNIANIGLILGLTLFYRPIRLRRTTRVVQVPLLLGITFVAGGALIDSHISRIDGIILIGLLVLYLVWLVRRRSPEDFESEVDEIETEPAPLWRVCVMLVLGLVGLLFGSRSLIGGAVETATALGVDSAVIGLTVVAIGTSLPELAASLMAAKKGQDEIVLGNVIGSNIFNLLTVLALPGLIHPTALPAEIFSRDVMMMLILTLGLMVFVVLQKTYLRAVNGFLFLLFFVAYYVWVFVFPDVLLPVTP